MAARKACNCSTTAMQKQRPYALAFVDMRMPQGWDGAKTIEAALAVDPLQVVVCTAYSDYSWDDLLHRLQGYDRLLILKKPFDNIEVQQMANTLANKWHMAAAPHCKPPTWSIWWNSAP